MNNLTLLCNILNSIFMGLNHTFMPKYMPGNNDAKQFFSNLSSARPQAVMVSTYIGFIT